jgi:hypothetical protein
MWHMGMGWSLSLRGACCLPAPGCVVVQLMGWPCSTVYHLRLLEREVGYELQIFGPFDMEAQVNLLLKIVSGLHYNLVHLKSLQE